jgi:hypothetical protein
MAVIDLQSHEGFYGTDDEDRAPDWLPESHGGLDGLQTEDSESCEDGLQPLEQEDYGDLKLAQHQRRWRGRDGRA